MVFRNYRRLSAKAVWSGKITFIALQLLLFTVILHRFASLYTPAAVALFGLCIVAAIAALLLALWALKQIWRTGFSGTRYALLSIFMALLILAGPAFYLPKYLTLPAINDITTDFNAPPNYDELAEVRKKMNSANSIMYSIKKYSSQQRSAYPHIQPMVLERSVKEAYELVHDAVKRLGWNVVSLQTPARSGASGWIEATHKTLIMGYVDDVVIRVSGDDAGARIDVRSSSRFGAHDLGRNAQRIDRLFVEIRTSLAKGEQELKLKKKEEKKRAERLRLAEQRRREKAAAARLKRQQEFERRRAEAEANGDTTTTEEVTSRRDRKREKRRKRKQRNREDAQRMIDQIMGNDL